MQAPKNRTKFHRAAKDSNYSIINNEFLRCSALSWRAKGILAYLLMLPDDWDINLNEIMRHATEGERAFRNGWRELVAQGFVHRYPVHDGSRIVRWQTEIYEVPRMDCADPDQLPDNVTPLPPVPLDKRLFGG